MGSALTLTFNESLKLIGRQEFIARNLDDEYGMAEYWVNGQKKLEQKIDKPPITTQSLFSCVNDCLASQGIPNWVIGVFVLVCGAACGTVILCAACIEGPLLAYGLQIEYCIFDVCS